MDSESVSKFVHQRLINVRDKSGEEFNTLLTRYALERLVCGEID